MVDSDEYILEAKPDLSSDEYVFLYPFFACLVLALTGAWYWHLLCLILAFGTDAWYWGLVLALTILLLACLNFFCLLELSFLCLLGTGTYQCLLACLFELLLWNKMRFKGL
jgi:hypothetical protein